MSDLKRELEKARVEEIRADYEKRAAQRGAIEAKWKLCERMTEGEQFTTVAPGGIVIDEGKSRYWEERTAFNHLSAILETRLARLARVRPKLCVFPRSNSESDIAAAKASGKILDCAFGDINVSEIIAEATTWSELTGTAFYQLSWDAGAGMTVGKEGERVIKEGNVRVDVCSPYEIFPDSIDCRSTRECRSIIHAKSVRVGDVRRIWGVDVEPDGALTGEEEGRVLVIERYTRPSDVHPRGVYEAVAGDKMLADGELPFFVGEDMTPDLPFIRQRSMPRVGQFYGTCPIEHAIPVQRAYNAVKNRKHEFMNRIAAGVLAVEEGSVDVDELEEGLAPGKVLVYRAGSVAPAFLDAGTIPEDFDKEEKNLLEEFAAVSGVSEFMANSSVPSTVKSGSALQLLIEQDESRLSVSADEIRNAVKEMGKMALRLYRQFALPTRVFRSVDGFGNVETLAWNASSLSGEVVIDVDAEQSVSVAARRTALLKLLDAGLLGGETDEMRRKILQAFGLSGFGGKEVGDDLQRAKADRENADATQGKAFGVRDFDDDALHIDVHTAFALSKDTPQKAVDAIEKHIIEHREKMKNFKEE